MVFNFWQPRGDGGIEHDFLLDAAVAKLVLPSKENENAETTIFHFKVEETLMHRNPFQNEVELYFFNVIIGHLLLPDA